MERMPAWVSYLFHFEVLKDTEQISIASVLTSVMHIDFRVILCLQYVQTVLPAFVSNSVNPRSRGRFLSV